MTMLLSAFAVSASLLHLAPLKMPDTGVGLSKAHHAKGECSDFTGHWKGQCTNSDSQKGTNSDTVTIEQQGCDYISLESNTFSFGGAYTIGQTQASGFTYVGQAYVDWNASLTGVHMRMGMTGRKLNEEVFVTVADVMDLTLVNGQLITKSKSLQTSDVSGRTSDSSYWEECTYDKAD